MAKDHRYEVWQEGLRVAVVIGSDQMAAFRDAMHYAMMYAQDGPMATVKGVIPPEVLAQHGGGDGG
jgi:hypothetical protein